MFLCLGPMKFHSNTSLKAFETAPSAGKEAAVPPRRQGLRRRRLRGLRQRSGRDRRRRGLQPRGELRLRRGRERHRPHQRPHEDRGRLGREGRLRSSAAGEADQNGRADGSGAKRGHGGLHEGTRGKAGYPGARALREGGQHLQRRRDEAVQIFRKVRGG